MSAPPPNKQQGRTAVATRPARASRPRWVLVRQGEGPARKWVWQLAGLPGSSSGVQESTRQ
jgi:hypothetical protein